MTHKTVIETKLIFETEISLVCLPYFLLAYNCVEKTCRPKVQLNVLDRLHKDMAEYYAYLCYK